MVDTDWHAHLFTHTPRLDREEFIFTCYTSKARPFDSKFVSDLLPRKTVRAVAAEFTNWTDCHRVPRNRIGLLSWK